VAVILAGNLLLLYAALQLLTLAWSGALDESARRQRSLRVSQQLAGVGLLAAAALSVRAVDTSAFSGVPSDTLGPIPFALALLPVFSRVGALAFATHRPRERVCFEPAVAWAAPAGYLALRLLSLTAGRPPNQLVAILLFGTCLAAAALLIGLALMEGPSAHLPGRLLAVQAVVALGLSASTIPVMAAASTWILLLLIPLAGVASINLRRGSVAGALRLVALSMVPPSAAFVGAWLGLSGLSQGRFSWAILPLLLILLAGAAAAAQGLELRGSPRLDLTAGWSLALLLVGAFPGWLLSWLVLPAARAVRSIPRGTLRVDLLGVAAGGPAWPAAIGSGIALGGLALLLLGYGSRLPMRRAPPEGRPAFLALPSIDLKGWSVMARRLPWVQITLGAYLALVLLAIVVR
jgi:hypothetical protein